MGVVIIRRKALRKAVSAVLCAALVLAAIVAQVGGTYAAPPDVNVTLQCESGITPDMTIEKGQSKRLTAANLHECYCSDTDKASVSYTKGSSLENITVTGANAGIAPVCFGTKHGLISFVQFQITDSGNISAYRISGGGVVYFSGMNETRPTPVSIPAGSGMFSRIVWSTLDAAVATVSPAGSITSVGKGVTTVVGSFTDKWGVKRDLHIAVGVEEGIGAGVIGPDSGGNYYRAVGNPPNVYEVVDRDGASKAPPRWVYNPDGDPVNRSDRNVPALPHNGGYYVEDPAGSNIWKRVGGSGALTQSPAIWGGADRQLGGGDDREAAYNNGSYYVEDPAGSNIWKRVSGGLLSATPAIWGGADRLLGGGDDRETILFLDLVGNGSYWVGMGQNIWRRVDTPTALGDLTGGGPNDNPAQALVRPVYYHPSNGKYYVGPLIPPNGDQYYYGDKLSGGDAKVNSTTATLHTTDQVFYLVDGNMVTTKPVTGLPGVIDNTDLNGKITDDTGREWYVAKKQTIGSSKFAMLVSVKPIYLYSLSDKPQAIYFDKRPDGECAIYEGSEIQSIEGTFYRNYMSSQLKAIAVKPALGSQNDKGAITQPTTTMASSLTGADAGKDITFVLSYQDAVNWRDINMNFFYNAYRNIHTLNGMPAANDKVWLRTNTDQVNMRIIDAYNFTMGQEHASGGSGYIIAGLWVKTN